MKRIIQDEIKHRFKPEFVNRIDETVIFRPLSRESLVKIAGLLLERFAEHLKQTRGIVLKTTYAVRKALAEKAYEPAFGARALRRVIQTEIEDPVADLILEHAEPLTAIRCYREKKTILFECNEGGQRE